MCGLKSRGNWQINICLKKCSNKDIKCNLCYNYSKYEEVKNDSLSKKKKKINKNFKILCPVCDGNKINSETGEKCIDCDEEGKVVIEIQQKG